MPENEEHTCVCTPSINITINLKEEDEQVVVNKVIQHVKSTGKVGLAGIISKELTG